MPTIYYKTNHNAGPLPQQPNGGPVSLLSKAAPWPRIQFDGKHFRAWYLNEIPMHRRSYETAISRYFYDFGYHTAFGIGVGTQLLAAAHAVRLTRHGASNLPRPHFDKVDMTIPYAVRRALSVAAADPHKMTPARYDKLVAKNTIRMREGTDSLVIGVNYSIDQLRYECVHGIPNQFIAFKIVTKERKGPSYGASSAHTYDYQNELTEPNIDMDHNADCAAGLNVGTLRWCLAQRERGGLYTRAHKPDYKILAVRVYLNKTSRVCVPRDTEGKFRVERLQVLGEIDAWAAAFHYMQDPQHNAYEGCSSIPSSKWVLG